MYQLTRYINKKARIFDSRDDVWLKFSFETFEEAEQYVVSKNKEILKKDLASYRYGKEVEGINFGGVIISTDREAQAQFNAAYSAMKEGLTDSISWKGNDKWVEIDGVLAKEIAGMTVLHVQKCFKCEKSLFEDIDSLNSIPDTETYDIEVMWSARFDSL